MLDIRDHAGIFGGGKELKFARYEGSPFEATSYSSPTLRGYQFDHDNGDYYYTNGGSHLHYRRNQTTGAITYIKGTSDSSVIGYYKDYYVKFNTTTNVLSFHTHANVLIKQITVPTPTDRSVAGGCLVDTDKILYARQVYGKDWTIYNESGSVITQTTVENFSLRALPILNYNGRPMWVNGFPTTDGGTYNYSLPVWMGYLKKDNTIEQKVHSWAHRSFEVMLMQFLRYYMGKF